MGTHCPKCYIKCSILWLSASSAVALLHSGSTLRISRRRPIFWPFMSSCGSPFLAVLQGRYPAEAHLLAVRIFPQRLVFWLIHAFVSSRGGLSSGQTTLTTFCGDPSSSGTARTIDRPDHLRIETNRNQIKVESKLN